MVEVSRTPSVRANLGHPGSRPVGVQVPFVRLGNHPHSRVDAGAPCVHQLVLNPHLMSLYVCVRVCVSVCVSACV